MKQSAVDALKIDSKRATQITVKTTDDLIGNKNAEKNYRSLKNFTTE